METITAAERIKQNKLRKDSNFSRTEKKLEEEKN